MSKCKRVMLVLASLLSLAGCAGYFPPYSPTPWWTIRETAFTNLKPGVTTKEEVRKLVGIPLSEMHFPRQNEDVWEYRYLEGTTIIMIAYVHFGPDGVYKFLFHMLDPAFTGTMT
jgi:outer membrane protein assembly factor BamE (lipoprotein component of BamABCDE complex)